MALVDTVYAPWIPSVPRVVAPLPDVHRVHTPGLPVTPVVNIPQGLIVYFPEEMQAGFGGSGALAANLTGVFLVESFFSGSGTSQAVMYPIQVSEAGFSGLGAASAVTVQLMNIGNVGFSGSGTFTGDAEVFTAPTRAADFSGSGTASADVIPVIVSGFSGAGSAQVVGYGIFAGATGSGSLSAALTKVGVVAAGFGGSGSLAANAIFVGLLSAGFTGSGSMGATLVTFTPTGMDKNASAHSNITSRVKVTGWDATTGTYPGSIVTNNSLIVVGSKLGASITATIPVTSFFGITLYLMHGGVQVDSDSRSNNGTLTLTATRDVVDGDEIYLEASGNSTGNSVNANTPTITVT